jgi:hypothetical protein
MANPEGRQGITDRVGPAAIVILADTFLITASTI